MGSENEFACYLNAEELAELEEMREDLEHEEPEYIEDLEMSELFF